MSHKALIAVVGPSGSGKSTSLRNLNPLTTVILDGERKGFPWRGSDKFKILPFANPQEFDNAFKAALEVPNVELVVVESFTKLTEQIKKLCQTAYKGYEIWGNYAKMVRDRLNNCKNGKAAVCFTAIDEIVAIPQVDGTELAKRLISVDGKELRGKIEYEFLLVLFTEPRKNPTTGKIEYHFQTNTDAVTSAKTPLGMFDAQLISNDLAEVLKRAKEYYTETKEPLTDERKNQLLESTTV